MALYGLSRRSVGGLPSPSPAAPSPLRGLTGHCGVYQKLGLDTAEADAYGRTPAEKLNKHGIHVEVAYSIQKPRQELYAFFRNFDNLPKFMKHLQTRQRDRRDAVPLGGPGPGRRDRVVGRRHHQRRARRADRLAQPGRRRRGLGRVGPLPGRARRPRHRGEGVDDYVPPGGKIGAAVAKLFGRSGESEVREDLRRFKQLMEAGEVTTIDGQSHGARSALGKAVLTAG